MCRYWWAFWTEGLTTWALGRVRARRGWRGVGMRARERGRKREGTMPQFPTALQVLVLPPASAHHPPKTITLEYFLSPNKCHSLFLGFPGSSAGEESACNAEDPGLIPGSGRSPGGGHGNPLQYSSLENFMDWIAHGVAKHGMWLNDFHFTSLFC